ncbi:MAG: mannonate dehydratase [Armatimonadetes bacterium]|nr:mannonate dehydratase [Armatimonadota bacterium]
MKLTMGVNDLTEETLRYYRQLGVTHLKVNAGDYMDENRRGPVQSDKLNAAIEQAKRFDLKIEVALLPQEKGSQHWNIRLGGPGRDQEIEDVCQSLDLLGKAGVPVVEYVFNLQAVYGVTWQGNHWGRGGAEVIHFDYDRVRDEGAPTPEEEASAEQMWDRIEYFLKRVVPAAEAAEVRLACHPNDPPVPCLRGEDRVLGSLEGMKRLVELVPSEANGLNFCQGTVAEMGVDVLEAIRYFGSRDKINHVHFRNVRGAVPIYDEVFIDEGKVDMIAAMRAYKEVGYKRTIMPDHTPQVLGDTPDGKRGFAYALGYMRAAMQALGVEAE